MQKNSIIRIVFEGTPMYGDRIDHNTSELNMNNEIWAPIWIPVKTSPGMFPFEAGVELQTAEGRQVSFFADRTLIRSTESGDEMEVVLVEKNEKEKTLHVLLPVETFETGTVWVDVRSPD